MTRRLTILRIAVGLAAGTVALAAALAVQVAPADAMWCAPEYRTCATDDDDGGNGGGGGGTVYGFYVGQKLPGTPESLQAAGWKCNNLIISVATPPCGQWI